MNTLNELKFEQCLKTAFGEYIEEQISALPSEEELKKEFPVPRELIEQAIKHKKVKKTSPLACLKKVAVIFLAVSVILFCALMLDEDIRAAFSKTIEKWYNGFYELVFDKMDNPAPASETNTDDFVLDYLPEGFELKEMREGRAIKDYFYENGLGERINISVFYNKTNVIIDTENADYAFISNENVEYWLNYNDDGQYGNVIIEKNDVIIRITSTVSKDELIKFFEKNKNF